MRTSFSQRNIKYLELLSKQYPTISAASTEIINLQAILNLPKGTEHFLSDIHGEYEAFNHVLRNASGVIKNKIKDLFEGKLSEKERASLATVIYYPEDKLKLIKLEEKDIDKWYRITLFRLIQITRVVASKYTRSKVRKAFPEDFAYILNELLHEDENSVNKEIYYKEIVDTIIRLNMADDFIIAISKVIQQLSIDRLHVLGDIFDRGPAADKILDILCDYHSVDVQWGNHDVVWMGAASGSKACIANVLRICTRYGNFETLEDGYGINTMGLTTFAMANYTNNPASSFKPKVFDKDISKNEYDIICKIHKAISIIQFKLEGQIIKQYPEFEMQDRLLLDKINPEKGIISIYGKEYKMLDTDFPTIDWEDPYKLSDEEDILIDRMVLSFRNSSKLQKHVRFLFNKGSMYKVFNGNLLFHGCIPLDKNGSFRTVNFLDNVYSGKDYFDQVDRGVRVGYFGEEGSREREFGQQLMWYLWCGKDSPLFGKNKMTTFERYFLEDKETHKEEIDYYFSFRDNKNIINMILEEYELNKNNSYVINGHIPVKVVNGESPIKAGGKLYDIDGGFSKVYQNLTGIAGYTLIFNSYGLILVSHEAFESQEKAIHDEVDILSSTVNREYSKERILISGTDVGKELLVTVNDLELLLNAFRKGYIKERN